MEVTLASKGLTAQFGGHRAVDAVSAEFHAGELTAIVGPNGAGKTTYFNLLSGQLAASEGSVSLRGKDITRLSAPARARLGIGRAFQLTQLFPRLSVLENVRLAVQSQARAGFSLVQRVSQRADLAERALGHLQAVGLAARADSPAASLSHGDKRKLEISMLLALDPTVLMLDEPTAGMSADDVPVVLDLIRQLRTRRDRTILLVEHKMEVIRSLADRIVVLHNGRLMADGDPATVMDSALVREAYLGVRAPALKEAA